MGDLRNVVGKKANKMLRSHAVGQKVHGWGLQVGKKAVRAMMGHPVSAQALAGFTQGAAAAQSGHQPQGDGMPRRNFRLQLRRGADRRRNDKAKRSISLYPPGHQPQWATPQHLRK
jgi:hypothetical protein